MAKRRPSGDGMVRKREDGRWEGRIVIGHKADGTPIFHYVSAKTQKELLKKLHQNIEEYRDVNLNEGSKMPLSQWLDRWLEEYAAPSVRPSTLDGYRRYIERNLKPYLGDKPVGKTTREDVQKLYRELQKNGRKEYHPEYGHKLSGSSIRRIHGVFHQAMDAAVRENLIARNPTEGITLPKKKTAPKQILNDDQLARFMEVIRADSVWHDFFYTELTTGLRRGEICGLIKTLSTIIGHVSAETTLNTYTHITDEMRRKAALNIDQGIAKAEVPPAPKRKKQEPARTDFVPVPLSRRRPGTGCISQINETLWEGRYSPKWPDGVKRPRNVYAHSLEECEEKLKELILEIKGEMAALRSGASTEYPEDGNSKKNTITAYLREHPGVTNKSRIARDLQMDRSTVRRYYDEIRGELRQRV